MQSCKWKQIPSTLLTIWKNRRNKCPVMNLRRRHKIQAEVNAASMNDNMFFLMLFFLIASLVINPNVIRVQNPRSESGEPFSKETVNITLTEALQLYLRSEERRVGKGW